MNEPLDPYREPQTNRRWVMVATIHLPLGAQAIAECLQLLSAEIRPKQLLARPCPEDDSIIWAGYWVEARL